MAVMIHPRLVPFGAYSQPTDQPPPVSGEVFLLKDRSFVGKSSLFAVSCLYRDVWPKKTIPEALSMGIEIFWRRMVAKKSHIMPCSMTFIGHKFITVF
ncbi:MAG: hypothetical protein AB7F21_10935 [Desulfuromonadales bacterium]